MQLRGHRVALRVAQRVALEQRRGVRAGGVGAHLGEQRLELRPADAAEHVLIPGHRGVARQVHRVGALVARQLGEDRLDVGGDRDQDQAVEGERTVLAQVVDDGRGAGGAVALAEQVLRRGPAVVVAQVLRDEAADRLDVRIDAPELVVLVIAHRVAQAGADRVDHHQVALVEQSVLVVDQLIGRRRRRIGIGDDDASRSEHSHVQP